MTSRYGWRAMLAGASFLITTAALATPQVVGDEACNRYEVDMASFASCTAGRVVLPARDVTDIPVAAQDGSRYANYFAPSADRRATFLATIMPGFDAATGMPERPEQRGCALAP